MCENKHFSTLYCKIVVKQLLSEVHNVQMHNGVYLFSHAAMIIFENILTTNNHIRSRRISGLHVFIYFKIFMISFCFFDYTSLHVHVALQRYAFWCDKTFTTCDCFRFEWRLISNELVDHRTMVSTNRSSLIKIRF